jgi:hypothetical protein
LHSGGDFLDRDLFCNEKCGGPSPQAVDQRRARSMVDWPAWPPMELTRARPSGRSGPRLLATRWEKEGGRHRDSILPSTEAWKAARRWRIGGGTSAQKGDNVGAAERRRGQANGVGAFHWGGGGPFIGLGRGVEAVKAG